MTAENISISYAEGGAEMRLNFVRVMRFFLVRGTVDNYVNDDVTLGRQHKGQP
jgi:hypothetical protein